MKLLKSDNNKFCRHYYDTNLFGTFGERTEYNRLFQRHISRDCLIKMYYKMKFNIRWK